jgi:uncharacterized protein
MTLRALLLLACGLFAGPLAAVPLWSVEHAESGARVLLLGSVHLLRAADQPLPEPVHAAYGQAGRVLMELDPAELAPEASVAALGRVGVSSPGGSLAESLDAADWKRARALAEAAGVDLEAVAGLEPWFAAIVLYTGFLAQAGYDPALGVDQQVAGWAARDGKPVAGLETLDEQLLLFKRLTADTQRELFLKTLAELATMQEDTGTLIAEWRSGDIAALADRLETEFGDFPELHDALVTRRNRAWLPAVEALLAAGETGLVVVGALHLVGPEGLPALLEQAGYRVTPVVASDRLRSGSSRSLPCPRRNRGNAS